MPDNVTLNPGAGGDTIASDLIGGIQFQRVKVVWGGENIASDTDVTYPLPVSLSGSVVNVALTNQPTVLASLTNISVAVNNPSTNPILASLTYAMQSVAVANTVAASLTGVPNVNVVNQPTVLASQSNTWAITVNNPSTNPVLSSLTYALQSVAVANTIVASLSNISVAVNNPATNPVLASLTYSPVQTFITNTPNVSVSNNPFNYATATAIGYKTTSETYSSVAGTTTSTTLVSTNTSRRTFTCFNDSTAVLYMKFGANATTGQYKVAMAAASFYEMPSDIVYTGLIAGIWGAATGNAVLTES